jgi:hypothetical protein
MNINMLRDEDDDTGFYAATCNRNPTAAWGGAKLYASHDGGANYIFLIDLVNEATMGYTANALGNFLSGNIVDEINHISVNLLQGELASVTLEQMLNGGNLAIVGDEIIQFRSATLESNGSYTLRGLMRGRRGSEYAMATHAGGERFILVDHTNLYRVPHPIEYTGIEKLYKAVGDGKTLAGTTAVEFTNSLTGLKPYAPAHLGGGRDASGNLTLNWIRRTRIDGGWRDGVDVALGEDSEEYEVEIYNNSGYASVVRTITGLTSPTTPYSAADQTTDFGSPQATVYFKVYQLSATAGRGHAASGQA